MLKAVDILWETDGDKEAFKSLPISIGIPDGMTDPDEISDYISDRTGFLHNGFKITSDNKYLVTVTETYKHQYLVEGAYSEEDAADIVATESDGCDTCDDYCGSSYSVKDVTGHALCLTDYDICKRGMNDE